MTRDQLIELVSSIGFYEAVKAGAFDSVAAKAQVAALTPLATDADLPTTVLKVNAIIAALKA
ncbi:hypothetical protein D3C80_345330 [compost metagenome]